MPSRYEKYVTHHTSRRTDGWDYTQPAAYFVTICTQHSTCLFGTVRQGRMHLNVLGRIVAAEWRRSEEIRDRVHLDAFVVMPNHLHGIVVFADPTVDAPTCPRNYRPFGGETTEPANSASTDDPDDPSNSPDSESGSIGGATESTDPSNSTKASTGGSDDRSASEIGNNEKASHGGATLVESDGEGNSELNRPPRSLGSMIAGFKSAATTRINDHRGTPGAPVWQRNYHDRIIRTERHWRAARAYIRRNPADWGGDRMNQRGDAN